MLEPLSWHRALLAQIAQRMEQQRLPHALMLRGRTGDGLFQAARAIAALRLCQNPVGGQACGSCKSCQLAKVGSHPDLHLLQPEESSRVIKIDAVRELVSQFAHTPQVGQWKLALIFPANQLNLAAANALLKTLEEPPGKSLLLLAVEQHARVLPTLQSRCQSLVLPRPSTADADSWLRQAGIDAESSSELLKATAGEPLRALAWHQEGRLEEWRTFRQVLPDVASGKLRLSLACDSLGSLESRDMLVWYLEWLRDGLRAELGATERSRSMLECVEQASAALGELDRGTNPNAQLLLENILMQLQRLAH